MWNAGPVIRAESLKPEIYVAISCHLHGPIYPHGNVNIGACQSGMSLPELMRQHGTRDLRFTLYRSDVVGDDSDLPPLGLSIETHHW